MCRGLPTCECDVFWLQLLGNECFMGKPSLWSIFNVSLIATLQIDVFHYSSSVQLAATAKALVALTWLPHVVVFFTIACKTLLPKRDVVFLCVVFFFWFTYDGWIWRRIKSLHVLCVTLAEEQRHTHKYFPSSNSWFHSQDAAENPPPSSEQAYF